MFTIVPKPVKGNKKIRDFLEKKNFCDNSAAWVRRRSFAAKKKVVLATYISEGEKTYVFKAFVHEEQF